MARTAPFERHHGQYDQWFERHRAAYVSELLALRPFVPVQGRGLEIGVGTARFAAPLGVQVGVDPAAPMLTRATARGVRAVAGTAEALPFASAVFDHALVVTTICFVDSPEAMLAEASRVLVPGGRLVIGFIDRDSDLGQHYLAHRLESVFYRDATFHSASEVDGLLRDGGFEIRAWVQTLFGGSPDIPEIQTVRPGSGTGAFVVVAADRRT
ncbi:MAG: class I SAM-dependent methyltransferase [Vicinamibacterales bacterium]